VTWAWRPPWGRRRQYRADRVAAEAAADRVDREVKDPLRRLREPLEHNHLARMAAEGLGISGRRNRK
jgi:hypothetical protein